MLHSARTGKPVQLHHIDEDPSNHDINDLAVLCLDCHNLTQLIGGFSRKLDAEQVTLYREDWVRAVARKRVLGEREVGVGSKDHDRELQFVTMKAEILRENEQWDLLASHYHIYGNYELRDKYIEEPFANLACRSTLNYFCATFKESRNWSTERS